MSPTTGAPAVGDRAIRTLIVDDHELVAEAIKATIDRLPDFAVVGVATSIEDGLAAASRLAPSLLLTDLRLGDGDVVDHLDRFKSTVPGLRVLVMTGMVSEGAVLQVLRAGADGYIMKTRPLAELVDAARRVAAGELVYPAAYVRSLLVRECHLRLPDRQGAALTNREVEVLQLFALGHSTAEVAGELHLAVNTIRNHLAAAMAKLGVGNRLRAVAEAIRLGIVSPPSPVCAPR